MRGMIARMETLDESTILSSVDPIVRERISSARILPRLVMRRGRRIASKGLFAPALKVREEALLNGGADLIVSLSHTVGVHILWQEVVRLVRRLDADALNDALGVASRDIALVARDEAVGVTPISDIIGQFDLAERARREGALSWACWLAACDSNSARQLRVFTPLSVSTHVQHGLPDDPEQRKLRRRVVEFEIDRLTVPPSDETSEEELQ